MSSNGIPARQSQTSTSTEYTLIERRRYLEIRWPLPYRTRNTARTRSGELHWEEMLAANTWLWFTRSRS